MINSPNTLAVIDFEVLDRLRVETTPELVTMLVDEFTTGLMTRLQGLEATLEDHARIAAEAHILKSEAATFGAKALAASVAQLEEVAQAQGEPSSLFMALSATRRAAHEYIVQLETSALCPA